MNRFEISNILVSKVLDNYENKNDYHWYCIYNDPETEEDIKHFNIFKNKNSIMKMKKNHTNVPESVGFLIVREKIKR